MAKDFDVVVLGATGVTGRRVARYLASRAVDVDARWAAAGRSAEKVARALAEEGVAGAEILVADVTDPRSVAAIAERARVVLNLVGPYTPSGRPVVAACLAAGAHYADLSGEMQFVRRTIGEFDGRAKTAGVKIVQPAGFESLPPDLLVRALAEGAKERFGEPLAEVDLELRVSLPAGLPRPTDGMSGGTAQTIVAVVLDDDAAVVADPAALITDAGRAQEVRHVSPIRLRPRRGHDGRSVIAPMIPVAYINPAVIQRSAAIAAPDDPPFRYREGSALPGTVAMRIPSLALAGVLSGMQALTRMAVNSPPRTRLRYGHLMQKVMPTSGFGPRPERLEGWKWSMTVHARTTAGYELRGEVSGTGHVGYLATAKMIGEVGLLLAEDDAVPSAGGCLPPALALGTGSLARFAHAGLTFRLD